MEEAAIHPISSSEKLREQRRSYPHLKETDIVGFRKEENILLQRLIGGESRRCVISVVGMGGLGKTTLAQKVYNNDDVQKCFSYRAWVCVSQEYKLKDLLEKIAKMVMGLRKEELEKMDMDDLVEALSGFLRERRYLIVLDDIWEVQVWNDLKIVIPDTMNGSRVLLTTRDKKLALDADRRSTPIELHLLNEEESWKLFAQKALIEGSFEAATCPSELVQIGQAIVARCGGLPLAIVVLGGLLSIKDCDSRSWLKVLENVVWQLAQGSNCCLDILGLSYNDLPYNLKPCLLYLGLFPKDHEISVMTLIKLWVAEGFIQQRGQLTMEEVAEDCLEELIQRSLIQVVKRRHDGGPKTCRIHDLIRNLLVSKAEQDLFFMIDGSRHTPPSLNLRRLAILYSEGKSECSYLNQPTPRLRSLLCFSKLDQKVVVRLLNGSATLLRVLDLSGVKDYSTRSIHLPKEIGELVHLRYLNLENSGIKSLPSTMGKLTNLQTLNLNGNHIKYMTSGISYMCKLRHLYSDFIKMRRYYRLDSLEKLQTLGLHSGKWIENGLSKLKALRKLSIFGFPSKFQKALPESIEKLSNLRSLKIVEFQDDPLPNLRPFFDHPYLYKLNLSGRLNTLQPSNPNEYPPNLTKLTLRFSQLQQDPMETLEKLPNLCILELLQCSYDGDTMLCSAQGFPRLESLKLSKLDGLTEWTIEKGAMRTLASLVIDGCGKLEMLPTGLIYLTTLRELHLGGMSGNLMDRVRENVGKDWHKIQHVPYVWRKGL